jgi:hypothetical protein
MEWIFRSNQDVFSVDATTFVETLQIPETAPQVNLKGKEVTVKPSDSIKAPEM